MTKLQLNETQVFLSIKNHLLSEGWSVIGGQPPSGTDNLPVIEIRDPNFHGKGSKGSYKPDLIAWSEYKLFIIELKPTFNSSDLNKVTQVLTSPERIESLWESLIERNIEIGEIGPIAEAKHKTEVVGGLGYGGQRKNHPVIWRFFVEPGGVEVTPGSLTAGKE